MSSNKQSYRINFEEEKIIIPKKMVKEASILNSEAYRTINQLRKDFPTYQIVQKEIRKKKDKRSYANLTIKTMREHIALLEGENSETMRQFEYLYAFYEVHKGRYAKLKAWYLEHYKDEYKDGNDEAKKCSASMNA